MRPCIERMRNTVLDAGFRATSVRGMSFHCQCPAHNGGDLNAKFFETPDGKMLFHCHSRGCSWQEAMESLDLVHADFFPPDLNPLKPKRGPEVDLDEVVILCAEHDRAQGIRLSEEDQQRHREALMRRHGRNAA